MISPLQHYEATRSAAPCLVQVSRNAFPRRSWQAACALGPMDWIIVDGPTAAQAMAHLLALLPAAMAARPHARGSSRKRRSSYHVKTTT